MTSVFVLPKSRAASSRGGALPPSRDGDSTQTSPSPSCEWSIGDRVTRLRQVGADHLYPLRVPAADDRALEVLSEGYMLGSADTCALRIMDPKRRVSKRHARVYYSQGHWHVIDLGSKNGFTVDGVRQLSARLSPGMVLGVGGVRLVAESARSIELRCYLARVMGWGWDEDPTYRAVENALQTVRAAHMRREALWIQGGGEDAVQVAMDLHRYLMGSRGTLVMCDPRRKADKGTARMPGNQLTLADAMKEARGGTVCVRSSRLPAGFVQFLDALRVSEEPSVQIIVCDDGLLRERPGFAGYMLTIPLLCERSRKEHENIVREYFVDAGQMLGVSTLPRPEDRTWVLAHSASSLQDIAKGTLRLRALRVHGGSFRDAAQAIDMACPSLLRWVARRGVPEWLSAELPPGAADEGTAEGESSE